MTRLATIDVGFAGTLYLMNIATVSLALCGIALAATRLCRRGSVLFHHHLLLSAVCLTTLSPLLVLLPGPFTASMSPIKTVSKIVAIAPENALPDPVVPATPPATVEVNDRPAPIMSPRTSPAPAANPFARRLAESLTWRTAMLLIALAWAAGTVFQVVQFFRGRLVLRRLRRSLTIPRRTDSLLAFERALMDSRVRRKVQLFESSLVPAPLSFGLRRPAIVLPQGLADELTGDQLRLVLLHEAAHIVRRDHWIALIQCASTATFWWNPLLRVVNDQLARLREQICDDYAVAKTGQGRIFAEALLQVAMLAGRRFQPIPGVTPFLTEARDDLEQRVTRALDQRRKQIRLTRRTAFGVVAFAIALLGLIPLMSLHAEDKPGSGEKPAVDKQSAADSAAQAEAKKLVEEGADISGRIVLEDGSPATTKGWLYSEGKNALGNGYVKNEALCTDRFSITVPAGTVSLKYFPDGFAPVGVGPFETGREPIADVKIVLRPGYSSTVRVVSEDGAPIGGATIAALPVIGGSRNGPRLDKTTNQQGQYLFGHLATVPYEFLVAAPGHEPLKYSRSMLKPGETTTLSMLRSQPTTGLVLNADGTPAKGAKIRFRCEAFNNPNISVGDYGFGNVVATTDDAGRFTLDQLTGTSRYLFIVETTDKSRIAERNLRAGQSDVRIQVPKRRDLRVRIVGDLNQLPKSSGKPFIAIRQQIPFDFEKMHYEDLIGEDIDVAPSDEGGIVEYLGLVPGTVRVTAGGQERTVNVAEVGLTEVEFQLPQIGEARADVPDGGANEQPSDISISVVDATGKKAIPRFRVVAGAKGGSASETFKKRTGQEGINWQPHTVRVGKNGTYLWPLDRMFDETAFRIEADGYQSQISPWIKKSTAPPTLVFKLVAGTGVKGRVLGPDGQPAVGATVALAMAQRDAIVERGRFRGQADPLPANERDRWRRPIFVQTDGDGHFQLPIEPDPGAAVVIMHESGVAEMAIAEFQKKPEIKLNRWGRIEGRILWKDVPGADEPVSLTIYRDDYGYPGVVASYAETRSDAQGNFVFEKVLPGRVQISRLIPLEKGGSASNSVSVRHVDVRAGDPTIALIGGQGRKVTGRFVGRTSWEGVAFRVAPNAPHFGLPGDDEAWRAFGVFSKSAIGPLFFRDKLKPNADGSFEIPHLLPGRYQLFVSAPGVDRNAGYAVIQVDSEVPGVVPLPLDVGQIKVKAAEPPSEKTTESKAKFDGVTRLQASRKDESAIWFHTGQRVHFVLYHRGFLQSGLEYTKYGTYGPELAGFGEPPVWRFRGNINILDSREFPLVYVSKDPDTLVLDGKSFDLRQGRVIVLNVDGDPRQLAIEPPAPAESNLPVLARSINAETN